MVVESPCRLEIKEEVNFRHKDHSSDVQEICKRHFNWLEPLSENKQLPLKDGHQRVRACFRDEHRLTAGHRAQACAAFQRLIFKERPQLRFHSKDQFQIDCRSFSAID